MYLCQPYRPLVGHLISMYVLWRREGNSCNGLRWVALLVICLPGAQCAVLDWAHSAMVLMCFIF